MISSTFILSAANAFDFDLAKISLFCKELIVVHWTVLLLLGVPVWHHCKQVIIYVL